MSILPKFLYLMQALPVNIPTAYFRKVQSTFTTFVWAKQRPRLSNKILVLPKQSGGLALPDVRAYYQAVHLGRLIDWCRHHETKLWTQLEQNQSIVPLRRAPWCCPAVPIEIKRHPLIGNTLEICARLLSRAPRPHQILPYIQYWGILCLHQACKIQSFGD